MAAVPQQHSMPELLLRKELFKRGLRYRLHEPGLPGRPDVVFRKQKVAVFVHGCFWHRHEGCRRTTTPKTNRGFWLSKFEANKARDTRNCRDLQLMGWKVVIVWECEIRSSPERAADRVVEFLQCRTRPDHLPNS